MQIIAKRLQPGSEIYSELKNIVEYKNLRAAAILTMVGSLSEGVLRFAGNTANKHIEGPLEIVSANGTLSPNGLHIHACFADSEGKTYGGHMSSGCIVNTTCEIVIIDLSEQWNFERKFDEETGYAELICSLVKVGDR